MITLFNKVLGENEECVSYFYSNTEGTFWPTQYLPLNLLPSLNDIEHLFLQGSHISYISYFQIDRKIIYSDFLE